MFSTSRLLTTKSPQVLSDQAWTKRRLAEQHCVYELLHFQNLLTLGLTTSWWVFKNNINIFSHSSNILSPFHIKLNAYQSAHDRVSWWHPDCVAVFDIAANCGHSVVYLILVELQPIFIIFAEVDKIEGIICWTDFKIWSVKTDQSLRVKLWLIKDWKITKLRSWFHVGVNHHPVWCLYSLVGLYRE